MRSALRVDFHQMKSYVATHGHTFPTKEIRYVRKEKSYVIGMEIFAVTFTIIVRDDYITPITPDSLPCLNEDNWCQFRLVLTLFSLLFVHLILRSTLALRKVRPRFLHGIALATHYSCTAEQKKRVNKNLSPPDMLLLPPSCGQQKSRKSVVHKILSQRFSRSIHREMMNGLLRNHAVSTTLCPLEDTGSVSEKQGSAQYGYPHQ